MTYVTWHLSHDLALQDTLRAELKTLNHPLIYDMTARSHGDSQFADPKQLDTLPILHAVIMETLRLRAPIPGGEPRVSPSPSSKVAGFEIPGGVRISASPWCMHRNSAVFADPEVWDYRRWLDSTYSDEKAAEAKRERDRYFWAFSSGARMCIGSNFAMHGKPLSRKRIFPRKLTLLLEMKLAIAALYTNFRTHIVNDDGIEQEDGYTAGPKGDQLTVRFEKIEI